jgi:hypothetical protein
MVIADRACRHARQVRLVSGQLISRYFDYCQPLRHNRAPANGSCHGQGRNAPRVRLRHLQPLDRDRHAIAGGLPEVRTPAPKRGAEQEVKREVAVPGISGQLSRVHERSHLTLIAGNSVRERVTQPRQARALLTVRIQLLGLAHQAPQQIRLACLERQLGCPEQPRASPHGIRAQDRRASGGGDSHANRTTTGKPDRQQLGLAGDALIGPDCRRSQVPQASVRLVGEHGRQGGVHLASARAPPVGIWRR